MAATHIIFDGKASPSNELLLNTSCNIPIIEVAFASSTESGFEGLERNNRRKKVTY